MGVYKIGPVLGRGGMATVYAASRVLDGILEFPVACKRIHAEAFDDPAAWRQFAQEAFLCRSICNAHPNLVDTYDVVEDGEGRFAIIMERVNGCTLQNLIGRSMPLPEPLVRFIARELLAALAYLHQRGVVHRDISPCNVLLSEAGEVKLSDLGLAKILKDGRGKSPYFIGKVTHASPEQLRADTIDARSDLYALGSVIYEMLTGAPPYGEERDRSRVLARMQQGPPPLADSVSDDLRALVRGLLQHSKENRHPATTAAALELLARESARTASAGELSDRVIATTEQRLSGATTVPRPVADGRLLGEDDRLLGSQDSRGFGRRRRGTRPRRAGRRARLWPAAAAALAGVLGVVVGLWAPWRAPESRQTVAYVEPASPDVRELSASPLTCEASEETTFSDAVVELAEKDTSAEVEAARDIRPKQQKPSPRPRRRQGAGQPAAQEPLFSVVPKRERSPWHIYKKEETP
ncbi:serine/threonine-protein kinase [Haliangium ochraceum]|uniref:Serine/threonine protein kinase n=1 Tax=Haliangium ochraceum (strain DSM 14365 / JCM 11303 / SMP-2) TaxID=502025 RepID=D0LMU1_HALO1|nr:serine/threonine-protein kinase [Haliangium ochraceum]ACY13312.1 serine/threonine protein kinase [Haliangium ochraceum DSM 14365]